MKAKWIKSVLYQWPLTMCLVSKTIIESEKMSTLFDFSFRLTKSQPENMNSMLGHTSTLHLKLYFSDRYLVKEFALLRQALEYYVYYPG